MTELLCLYAVRDKRLAKLLTDADALADVIDDDSDDVLLDIDLDDASAAIDFVVRTFDASLTFLRAGGRPGDFGDEAPKDVGAVRGFAAADVVKIASALASIEHDSFEGRLDIAALSAAKVPPGGWERARQDGDDHREHIVGYFDALRSFIAAAAKAKSALLVVQR